MKSCVVCNRNYVPKTGNQKCCSSECVNEWGRIKTKRAYELRKMHNVKHATCMTCQCEFDYHYRQERGERIFCSRSCASKHYIANGTFDSWRFRKNKKQQRIQVNCVWCNKIINVLPREYQEHLSFNMKHCCDRACRVKYSQKFMTGRKGHAFTDSMRKHQRETMISRYNVINAFMLAKCRTKSKPQIQIHSYLNSLFQDEFEIEKRITVKYDTELFADIISTRRKLIVEFNGDYWHCNPSKYDPEYVHGIKNQTARTIWENDAKRLEKMKKLGYNVYVIWEAEYNDPTSDWKQRLAEWVRSNGQI